MRPAELGADVCHINLHKTFCIPHGGGGPGMGPIGVKAHLARFLPGHRVVQGVNPAAGRDQAQGQVSAAPWGSASILPISWAYIAMMGGEGLTRATEDGDPQRQLHRPAPRRPFPGRLHRARTAASPTNASSTCAASRSATGITVEDVAKRLVDYGFHAPTMSLPVPDTMMIEPTESESKRELDRFCDAMIAIRAEIARGRGGRAPTAPTTCSRTRRTRTDLLLADWTRPYPQGARPSSRCKVERGDKYWPPVGRVDNVYGDRNLVCTCPPMEAYREAAE